MNGSVLPTACTNFLGLFYITTLKEHEWKQQRLTDLLENVSTDSEIDGISYSNNWILFSESEQDTECEQELIRTQNFRLHLFVKDAINLCVKPIHYNTPELFYNKET